MAPARDRRTGFSRRRQYSVFLSYVLMVALMLVGAALLLISLLDPPLFSAFRMGVAGITTPVSAGASAATRWVAAIPTSIGDHFFVRQENAALRDELTRERRLVVQARSVLYENHRLRGLLKLQQNNEQAVVVARLVASTATSGRRLALLDAGRFSGVTPGMPVRAADGLVGRVIETGPNAARVLLLTDADSIVPVRRASDGLPAVAAGRGDGLVDIRTVSGTGLKLKAGDLFVTSGIGGLYAPGIPVARLDTTGIDSVATRSFATPNTLDVALVERAYMPPPSVFGGKPQ